METRMRRIGADFHRFFMKTFTGMLEKKHITEKILGAFYAVYNELGYGFLERVYQNALYLELQEMGLGVVAQPQIGVVYKGRQVGTYFADLLVENEIILELKACECMLDEHRLQLQNYLKATDIELGFLLNFGRKPEFARLIFSNNKKRQRSR